MVKSFAPFAAYAAALLAAATAASLPDGSWPASTGTVQYSEAYTVKAGEVFDGKMQTFERSDISCEGQTESGSSTAVFLVEAGGTLKNVIIGKNQMEGVHCDKHDCTIENVWWDDVCEDALSIKGGTASSVSTVTGGGARYADDKVIQHNGFGTVQIDGFYGEDISKLYRSCGTCGDKARKVSVSNVYVVNPGNAVVTVNKNWGDEATLSNIWVKSSKSTVKVCQWSQGNANGEPKMLGNGPSGTLCQYAESDVHINEDISNAVQTAASLASSSLGVTQTDFSASTGSSVASVASSSEEDPTQTTSFSSLASSASALSQASSNSSSSDSSDATAPGTVSPVESGTFEQSVVSTDASQTEQEQSTDESTNAPSVSTSSSGSLYSSSDDISQTAVQQSSVASSSSTETPQNNVVLECDSSSGSSTEQSDVTSQPSSVASSSATDNSQTNVVLQCDSSSGSSAKQIDVPTQESTAASTSAGSDNAAQNEDQVVQFSTSGSTASSASVASSSSSQIEQSSGSDSATQNSQSDPTTTTQASSSGSVTQSSGSDSPTQSATNSSGSVPDGTWPASTGTVLYSKPYTIKAGEVFDGKMQTFERSDIKCTGGEGQKDSAVFLVEAGGTLKNAIIGKNQKEGVHCDDHDCTIDNVWWDDVCEDALSIKGGSASSVTTVTNCGARYAEDKVVQHNGYGTVKINGFFAQEFGKLYRSCGTCGNIPRTVTVENVYAIDPLVSVITVNKNYNDKATLKNIRVKTTNGKDDVKVCQWSKGSATPSNLGDGPSGSLCQYTTSDVHINDE